MNDQIAISVLTNAAAFIADTNNGLSGSNLISYCKVFAIRHGIRIPHAVYPFQAANKRTALLDNLLAFPPQLQYSLLMELCSDEKFRESREVKNVRCLIRQGCSHLGTDAPIQPLPVVSTPRQSVPGANTICQDAPVTTSLLSQPLESPNKPYDIYLSYAPKDEELMNLVREHLVLYDRKNKIRKWWPQKLLPGTPRDQAITHHLSSSEIILLFISASFLDSDDCYEVEMKQALRQHEEGRFVVVPIILRACTWRDAPFGNLSALPTDNRPLTAWSNRDDAAKDIAEGVMRIVAKLQRKQLNDPT